MTPTQTLASVTAAHGERLRAIDPLLRPGEVPVERTGSLIVADGAVGVHTVVDTDPASIAATWSELRRHSLSQIRIGGPDAAGAMSRLLLAWRERLAEASVPLHGESTAVLSWASRDAEVVKVLRNSGFTATAVLAARTGRGPQVRESPELTLRAIEPRDLDSVSRLHEVLMRWDDNFGGAHWRASTPARMREFVSELIGSSRPRAWVAEVGGEVVGCCEVEWPETAGWATAGIAADPSGVAYIGTMSVAPDSRGAGVGIALIAHVHRELDAAGIRLPVLHYAPLNPLSTSFWMRAGYRPVTTTWKAQPHTLLRAAVTTLTRLG